MQECIHAILHLKILFGHLLLLLLLCGKYPPRIKSGKQKEELQLNHIFKSELAVSFFRQRQVWLFFSILRVITFACVLFSCSFGKELCQAKLDLCKSEYSFV